jgi:hypothetical protein
MKVNVNEIASKKCGNINMDERKSTLDTLFISWYWRH